MSFLLKPYSPHRFINRDAEVSLITGILKQLSESGGQAVRKKTVLFRGERGFGKTWLSLHFSRTALKEFNVETRYLALAPLPPEYKDDLQETEKVFLETSQLEETCKEMMKWVCKSLKIDYPNNPSMVEMRRALVGGVEISFKQSHFLVLILDSVFEANWEFLEVVERNFLAPLAEIPNVMFIMTGRGRPYPWLSPVLRMGMREESLGGIPDEELEKFKMVIAPNAQLDSHKLADFGGRSPLVGYLLLQANDPIKALDAVADYLLDVVPPTIDRKRLRQAFEALCMLDEFREGEMEVMIKAYYATIGNPAPPISIRDWRDDLLKTYLFRWQGSGYKLDSSLQKVLQNYLKTNQKELWKVMNCTAYQIYANFARKYDVYKDEYLKIARQYEETLKAANIWEECDQMLQNQYTLGK